MPAPRIIDLWIASFRSAETRRAYRGELARFGEFTRREPAEAAGDLFSASDGEAHALLDAWAATMRSAGLSPATINRRLAAIVSLVRYARRLGATTLRLEPKRERARAYRDTRGPSLYTVVALLRGAEARDAPARDVALIAALFLLGLRRAEAVALNVGDVDLDGKRLAITGKGRGDAEPVTLSDDAAAAFAAVLAERPDDPNAALFVSLRGPTLGERMTGRGVAHRLAALSRAVGVPTVRPHGLRHAAITQALEGGADIRGVGAFARHKDIKTTTIYDDNRRDAGGAVASLLSGRLARAATT